MALDPLLRPSAQVDVHVLVELADRHHEGIQARCTPAAQQRCVNLGRMRGVAEFAELAGNEVNDLLADVDGVVADPLDTA